MTTIREANIRSYNTLKGEKHFQKALQSNPVRRLLFARFGFDVWQLPVCEKCEGYALWDKGEQGEPVGTCMDCGHTTKKPITVQQYYEEGHHIDRTVDRQAPVYLDRQLIIARR